jgi:3'-5' exoribonuclease-like protein
MKYFYDTEFIEDGKTIDLISIGVVADDGREFYAVSTEFNPKKASQWVKDNVLIHLPERHPMPPPYGSPRLMEGSLAWMSRAEIMKKLFHFIGDDKPEFWGYYSAYDHVALCQLFGTMVDLPKGWPMYTRDIKQWCDALGNPKLPEQGKGEHNALADARWNRRAYQFLANRAASIAP